VKVCAAGTVGVKGQGHRLRGGGRAFRDVRRAGEGHRGGVVVGHVHRAAARLADGGVAARVHEAGAERLGAFHQLGVHGRDRDRGGGAAGGAAGKRGRAGRVVGVGGQRDAADGRGQGGA